MPRRNNKKPATLPPAPEPAPEPTPAPEPSPLLMLDCIINGDVQMRGCRNSIESLAKSIGFAGDCINRPDGSVQVNAFATADKIPAIIASLATVPYDNRNNLQYIVTPVPSTIDIPLQFATRR